MPTDETTLPKISRFALVRCVSLLALGAFLQFWCNVALFAASLSEVSVWVLLPAIALFGFVLGLVRWELAVGATLFATLSPLVAAAIWSLALGAAAGIAVSTSIRLIMRPRRRDLDSAKTLAAYLSQAEPRGVDGRDTTAAP